MNKIRFLTILSGIIVIFGFYFVLGGFYPIALVDFNNDCVTTSLEVARVLGKKLFGVRLDSAETVIDKTFSNENKAPTGVNVELVKRVRRALDENGFSYVKIIACGRRG